MNECKILNRFLHSWPVSWTETCINKVMINYTVVGVMNCTQISEEENQMGSEILLD